MKSKMSDSRPKAGEIWVLVQQRQGIVEESTYGLIAEARRLAGETGRVTAVGLGSNSGEPLTDLGPYGAGRVVYVKDDRLSRYDGERYALVLADLIQRGDPACLLMAHSPEMADLGPRLAALLETGLVTHAVDLRIDERGKVSAIRPIANGYLFEEVQLGDPTPSLISFLPSVLSPDEPDGEKKAEILIETMPELLERPRAHLDSLIEAKPETLDLAEADIVVSGGRGMGKADSFRLIHDLAEVLGGSVAGTRPVIDQQVLPFERQIGQTGKTVSPRLLFACGISGANEFTAGMEKSQVVVAVNTDPRARIFRFADLGVVGDAHQILPLLVSRLRKVQ